MPPGFNELVLTDLPKTGGATAHSAPLVFTALLNRDPYLKISSDVPGLAGAIC